MRRPPAGLRSASINNFDSENAIFRTRRLPVDASLLLRTTASGAIPGSWSSDGPLDLSEVRSQMQISIMRGKVYLMGAGPGAAELLPAEAVSLLRAAEVVLHDEAVSPEVLELVSASAQVRNVDRLIESEAV